MVDRNLLEGGTVAAEHHRVVEVNRQARGGFTMLHSPNVREVGICARGVLRKSGKPHTNVTR